MMYIDESQLPLIINIDNDPTSIVEHYFAYNKIFKDDICLLNIGSNKNEHQINIYLLYEFNEKFKFNINTKYVEYDKTIITDDKSFLSLREIEAMVKYFR